MFSWWLHIYSTWWETLFFDQNHCYISDFTMKTYKRTHCKCFGDTTLISIHSVCSSLWRNVKNINQDITLSWAMPYYYSIYHKYSDTSTPYNTCSKIWTITIYYAVSKNCRWVANSVDPDETPHSAAVSSGFTLFDQACLSEYIW